MALAPGDFHRDPTPANLARREQVIAQYYPLVRGVVRRMTAQKMGAVADYEDMVGFGTVGLIQAVDRYDASRGVSFRSYAVTRIRGAIVDALRQLDPESRVVRHRARLVADSQSCLAFKLGREATNGEVMVNTGLTPSQLEEARCALERRSVSLDGLQRAFDDQDEGGPTELPGEEINPTESMERRELLKDLAEALEALPERDRLVLTLRYHEGLTTTEIGRILDVSESRVSQLHARAVERIRARLMPHWAA
ncbi:MAG: FliA/WhiG family RNA polymerase sigma factor [Chloroflexi bacterium]|nr:FliA/WhiG family RNA polymerase sigma factor [Chloroflexota bacterium]